MNLADAPTPAQSIISAIVTPAILILALSSLITTTANRLSLLLDRVRQLTADLERMRSSPGAAGDSKRFFTASQLGKGAKRARLLQRTLATLYLALGALLLTLVSIGVGAASGLYPAFIVFTVLGSICFLFFASTLLIRESRIALASVTEEMEYVNRLIREDHS